MKRLSLFITILLFSSAISFAQSSDTKPYVTINGLTKPAVTNGQVEMGYATSDRIIREGKLSADMPGAVVTSFTLSLQEGNTHYGPFTATGNTLTKQMTDAVRNANHGATFVTLSDIHVRYNGKNIVADNTTLRYDQ